MGRQRKNKRAKKKEWKEGVYSEVFFLFIYYVFVERHRKLKPAEELELLRLKEKELDRQDRKLSQTIKKAGENESD